MLAWAVTRCGQTGKYALALYDPNGRRAYTNPIATQVRLDWLQAAVDRDFPGEHWTVKRMFSEGSHNGVQRLFGYGLCSLYASWGLARYLRAVLEPHTGPQDLDVADPQDLDVAELPTSSRAALAQDMVTWFEGFAQQLRRIEYSREPYITASVCRRRAHARKRDEHLASKRSAVAQV
jgi:hypothetical protein